MRLLAILTILPFIFSINREDYNFVVDGDSQSVTSSCGTYNWSEQLQVLLPANDIVSNFAIAGQKTTAVKSNIGEHLSTSFDSEKINICIVWVGLNDLLVGGGNSTSNVVDSIETIVDSIVYYDYEPYILTQRCMGNWDTTLVFQQKIIQSGIDNDYNVLDVASLPEWYYENAYTDTTYYCPDLVHLTDASCDVIADFIYTFFN